MVSNISPLIDIDCFKEFLRAININALNVEYLLDEAQEFTGECRITVRYQDKKKTLEVFNGMTILDQQI
jgi:hypothetical protein